MKNFMVALAATAALAFALVSCGGDDDDDGGNGDGSGATCPTSNQPTYENFGRTFMTQYCTQCHASSLQGAARQGAPSDHNFDTLDAIKATEEEEPGHIDEEAAAGPNGVHTEMPPAGSPQPSESERRKLGEWVACGLP